MNFNKDMYGLGAAPSVIREIANYGWQRAAEVGAENVYNFSIGDPSVPAPDAVKQAMLKIINEQEPTGYHAYTPGPGAPDTRAAVAENLNKRFGVDFTADDIYMTCGAAASLNITLRALISDPKDEIIVVIPYFPEYKVFIESQGGVPVFVQPDEHMNLDVENLKAAITPNTKAVIINSPNNPAGVIYPEALIEEACKVLEEKGKEYGHPIYVIADEPYRELVFTEEKVSFIPAVYANTVVCYSWSKSLSLPGERIGYIAVPKGFDGYDEFIPAINGAGRALGYVNAPSLMQQVVRDCIDVMPDIKPYAECREALYDSLVNMGYTVAKPSGAFYMYIKSPDGNSEDFAERLKKYDVLVVPGTGFGTPEYVRLAYCCPVERDKKALPAFEKAMAD